MNKELTPEKKKNIESLITIISKFEIDFKLESEHSQYFDLCQKYKQVIRGLLYKPEVTKKFNPEEQTYVRQHILPDGTSVYFVWYIPMIEDILPGSKLSTIKMKIGPLMDWIDLNGLEHHRISYAQKNNKPVYVIDYAPSNLQVLIDGNHRVASRFIINQNENSTISSYLIPAEIHVRALISDFQNTMFKVLSNIGRMVVYLESIQKTGKGKKPHLFNLDHLRIETTK